LTIPQVVLYSERSRTRLEAWFGRSDDPEPTQIGLAAENGQFLRLPGTPSIGSGWATLGSGASAPGESAASAVGGAPAAAAVLSPIPSDRKKLAKPRALTGGAAGDAMLSAVPAAQGGAAQVGLHSG
jgi:hypothetical protein